jgi:8-oxo-dGTP pyrophosphatase MutT (NUDIX family)
MDDLHDLVRAALVEPPAIDPGDLRSQAAVAVLLRAGTDGPELLLIRRAERAGDVWSGHLALPGGRAEAQDATLEQTAIRETHEEVGIDLGAIDGARPLGALPPVLPRHNPVPISVHPFAWAVPLGIEPRANEEVAAAMWVRLASLLDPDAAVEHELAGRSFPGIAIGEHVLWGMTLRLLAPLLQPAGR